VRSDIQTHRYRTVIALGGATAFLQRDEIGSERAKQLKPLLHITVMAVPCREARHVSLHTVAVCVGEVHFNLKELSGRCDSDAAGVQDSASPWRSWRTCHPYFRTFFLGCEERKESFYLPWQLRQMRH
jgi:hypothetical protein